MDEVCFRSFRADWLISGKSLRTIDQYVWALRRIARSGLPLPPDLDLVDAREWLAKRQTEVAASTAHFEARALRVFSAFTAAEFGLEDRLIRFRLPHVPNLGAQLTTSEDDVALLLESFACWCRELLVGLSSAGSVGVGGCCRGVWDASKLVSRGCWEGPEGVVQAAVRYSLMSPPQTVCRSIGWPSRIATTSVVSLGAGRLARLRHRR